MSEQDRSVGGSDGAALLGARVDESIAAPVSESPEGVDNEPKAGSSHPQQTSTSNRDGPPQPAQKAPLFGIPHSSGARADFLPSMCITF